MTVLECFQRQADPMILVKNRLGKFYEQISWEIFTNVWEIATKVWETWQNRIGHAKALKKYSVLKFCRILQITVNYCLVNQIENL